MGNKSYQHLNPAWSAPVQHTLTNLRRWSCGDETSIPAVNQIKYIHIYDFDNTLFASPMANKAVWDGPSLGKLMAEDNFSGGGWWHNPVFLSATGEGIAKEEPRAWSSWWNEEVAGLCELSSQDQHAFSVLLTGRGEDRFGELIKRMLKSKGLKFDMICLKPKAGPHNQTFRSTAHFKYSLMADIMLTYTDATEIRIYEDRPMHVIGFREWLEEFNQGLAVPNPPRAPIKHEVVEVAMQTTHLDPVTEVAEVQKIINEHNLAFKAGKLGKRDVPYTIRSQTLNTGYLLKSSDTKKLIDQFIPPEVRTGRGVKVHADSIPIAMASANANILQVVGGIGHKVRFNITATGQLEDRLWAVRVDQTNPREKIHTLNHPPSIVLALKDARTKDVNGIERWAPIQPHMALQIETTVGEKTMLSIVPETAAPQKNSGRPRNDNKGEHHNHHAGANHNQNNFHNNRGNNNNNQSSNYRGGNQNRGRGQNRRDDAGGNRNRGRGGGHHRGGGGNRGNRGGGHGGHGGHGNAHGRPYMDYDAGGGRQQMDASGSDMFNAY